MIPAIGIIWKYRKLVTIILAVLTMSVLAWRIAAWRTGYLKLGAAVTALHNEQEGRESDRKTYLENSIKAEQEAQALAHDLGEIRARFANMATVLPKETVRVVEVPIAPGQTTCPDPRVSPGFVSVWNDSGKP